MIRSSWKEFHRWCEGEAALSTLANTSAAPGAPSRQRSAPSGLGEAGISSRRGFLREGSRAGSRSVQPLDVPGAVPCLCPLSQLSKHGRDALVAAAGAIQRLWNSRLGSGVWGFGGGLASELGQ